MPPIRPRLLYLSPIMPKPEGNGLAMRAALTLAALAERFDIDLFVLPVAGPAEPPGDFLRARVARIGVADPEACLDTHFALIRRLADPAARTAAEIAYPQPALSCLCTAIAASRLADWVGGRRYAALHVFRLYLAPLVARLRGAIGFERVVIDLDDDDAAYQDGLAALHADVGAAAEAGKYRALAARCLPEADLCLLAAPADRDRFAGRFPGTRFATLRNACPPARLLERATTPAALRLLFVGTLGYPPNADAAVLLIRDILPILRQRAPVPVRLTIAGTGAPPALCAMAEAATVALPGYVEDLAPLYAEADMVAAPLRFGGGSPIKLIEAFAFRRPVVATRFAAAGLEAEDGEHLLLADDAPGFAAACLRLWTDPAFAAACAGRAAALWQAEFHPDRVVESLADAYESLAIG
jgi:glycosyltransferase involved in cell wall biosynthesis